MRLLIFLTFGLLVLAAEEPAKAGVVIDFESLHHADDQVTVNGPEYLEDGFRLIATHPEPGNPHRLNTLGSLHFGYNGSTSAYNGVSNGEITLCALMDFRSIFSRSSSRNYLAENSTMLANFNRLILDHSTLLLLGIDSTAQSSLRHSRLTTFFRQ